MQGIYKITDHKGRSYIGSTVHTHKRFAQHKSGLLQGRHHNIFLQRVVDKHGIGCLTFELIESVGDRNNLFEREQYYIDTLKPEFNIGGVGGGDNFTKNPNKLDIKNRISKTLKRKYASGEIVAVGKTGKDNPNWRGGSTYCSCGNRKSVYAKTCDKCRVRTGEKNPFYGHTHSDETKQKLSVAKMGNKPANMRRVSIDGVVYESLAEAERQTGVSKPLCIYRIKSPKYNYHYVD